MQCRAGYHRTAETYRFENCDRSDSSCSSGIDFNINKAGLFYFRRILISDCPSRELDRISEPRSLSEVIELNYRAVDIVFELASHLTDPGDGIPDFICGLAFITVLDYLYAVALQIFITFEMGIKSNAAGLLNIEYKKGQTSFLCYPRIYLPESSGSAVPRIGKCLFSFLFSLRVNSFKSFSGHIDFAPDLDIRNRLFHLFDDIRDLLRIHCDVFTFGYAVTSCNCELQLTVLVTEGHRQSVDLCLYKELGLSAKFFCHRVYESIYVFLLENILER